MREESRLGDQCLSTDEVRCGGFPLSLCSSLSSPCCLLSSPLFHPVLSLCGSHRASRCHLLICLLGEVSVRWRSWTIPAHFPLERGSSPFVFQSGLGQALPAASWPASRILARSLTAALSLLCFSLFFFFFSPPSSLPSIMEKQFRFSRFTERGKGRGNIHASSNKCFSSSPRRGNSLLG